MKLYSIKNTCLFLVAISIFSCAEVEKKESATEKKEEQAKEELKNEEKKDRIKTIFFSLPSPLELTILFKEEGVEYHADKLHSVADRDKYITTVKKALNLGIYGANLSYAGLFSKHDDAIQYFSVSQILAADLGIGQTFQKEFITRLEDNANNKDTLLQVISDFFLENDSYLKDQKQQSISTHVLVGGWIEGLYLGTHMISEKTNASGVRDIIIGQENSLDNLIVLLADVGKSQEMNKLKANMIRLRTYYDEIEYNEVTEPSVTSSEGELVIDDGTGEPIMSDSTFNKIKTLVTEIRSSIIK